MLEETGIHTEVISDELFAHPAVTSHAPPYVILDMNVVDSRIGPHRHIDLVYVLRAVSGDLTAQLDEVSSARWVPIADLAELDIPTELPALVGQAALWAKTCSQFPPFQVRAMSADDALAGTTRR